MYLFVYKCSLLPIYMPQRCFQRKRNMVSSTLLCFWGNHPTSKEKYPISLIFQLEFLIFQLETLIGDSRLRFDDEDRSREINMRGKQKEMEIQSVVNKEISSSWFSQYGSCFLPVSLLDIQILVPPSQQTIKTDVGTQSCKKPPRWFWGMLF